MRKWSQARGSRRPRPVLFVPKNPLKYAGDPTRIVCRSSWEQKLARMLDLNDSVEAWASEEVWIPYTSPIDGAEHRYFPDFLVRFKSGLTVLVEVKPESQSRMPDPPKRKTQMALERFARDAEVYLVNEAKWSAAREWCRRNGYEFIVVGEREFEDLRILI